MTVGNGHFRYGQRSFLTRAMVIPDICNDGLSVFADTAHKLCSHSGAAYLTRESIAIVPPGSYDGCIPGVWRVAVAQAWRVYNCEDCGTYCRRKRPGGTSLICAPCGAQRAVASALALHLHYGSYWDRWLSGMSEAVARLHAERAAQDGWHVPPGGRARVRAHGEVGASDNT